MKRLLLALALTTSTAGCYGSYGAFNRVHQWNGHATDNKVANSLIHFAFWVLPVYPLCLVGDFLIFNNIEFITGSNPMQ